MPTRRTAYLALAGVPGLRQAFHTPSLAEAMAREKAMNEQAGRKSQAGDAK